MCTNLPTCANPLEPYPNPAGGALTGERFRVVVSTDIGGGDEDDDQSMVHYLLYADLFDTEGLISSPPMNGRKKDLLEVIDAYEKDYSKLKKHSHRYPTPDSLRSICKQGATDPAPEAGFSQPTEGSKWIVECAHRDDPRPLYVLVWGSIADVAQALHDDPTIADKIRVYFIASWNLKQDPNAFRYIDENHPGVWTIFCDTTFRGWYMGGEQGGDLGNQKFVERHAKGHGALGDYFAPLKEGVIKMGDTPSVAFLLRGDPNDPTRDSWGGRFVAQDGRPRWWVDDPDPAWVEKDRPGAKSVNRWREDYLRDFERRLDRCLDTPSSEAYLFTSFRGNGEDGLHLAYSYDGYAWTDLDKAFLAPTVGISKLMRDPCLVRAQDGTFHMVWTSGWNEKGIGYARSNDLIHWSEQKYIEVMAHEPTTANTWAPELFYDDASGQYIIFWASTIPDRFPGDDGHGQGRNHRMYCVTTKDFVMFSDTRLFFDPGHSVIDCILIRRDAGYTLILKDERRPMLCLRMAFGQSALGPFTGITEPFTEQYCEGPSALQIGGEWIVYFDMYHKHQYGAVKTRDFKTWTNLSGQVSFPKDHRHGTVLKIPVVILEGLKKAGEGR